MRHRQHADKRQAAFGTADQKRGEARQEPEPDIACHHAVSACKRYLRMIDAKELTQAFDDKIMIFALRNSRDGDGADNAGANDVKRKAPAMGRHVDRD